jgi:hypothetical protein
MYTIKVGIFLLLVVNIDFQPFKQNNSNFFVYVQVISISNLLIPHVASILCGISTLNSDKISKFGM